MPHINFEILDITLGKRTKNRYKCRSPKTVTFRANLLCRVSRYNITNNASSYIKK